MIQDLTLISVTLISDIIGKTSEAPTPQFITAKNHHAHVKDLLTAMHNTTAATGFHLQTSILLPCDVNTYAELNTKAQNFVEIDLALKTPTSQILIPQILPAHPKPGSHYHHPSRSRKPPTRWLMR
jgi:hypothetical protein